MFERNMLNQVLREDSYTWSKATTPNNDPAEAPIDFNTADLSNGALMTPRHTAVKLTPYSQGYLSFTGAAGAPRPITDRDNPILGMGSFKPRFALNDAAGQAELANNALLFTPSFLSGTFLRKWDGSEIRRVDNFLHPTEIKDVYDYVVSDRYDPSGFHRIGHFGNAAYTETATLTAEGWSGGFPTATAPDKWRFSGGAPAVNGKAVRLTGNFRVSHPMDLVPGALYRVEAQIYSAVTRACVVMFQDEAAARNGDSKTLSVKTGLNPYVLTLDASVGYGATPPSAGRNRLSLDCQDGSTAALDIVYARAHPEDGEALTYVYNPLGKLIQSVNENNVSTYYEYDSFGNLFAIRNDDGLLLSEHRRELTNVATP
jgi:YD repeat-containing protein